MNNKILITNKVHDLLVVGLEKLGFVVLYQPDFNPQNLNRVIPDLYGIIINSKIKMTATVLDLAKNLKFIGRLGSGLEIIDLEYAKIKNIHVFNSPEGNRNAVAEHAIGMLLNLSNNLNIADNQVRNFNWKREANRGFELEGKTIGLIGFGNTGQALASKLSGWALELIYCDPYVLNIREDLSYIRKVSLDQLTQEADIISLHVQLTEETKGIFNKSLIDKCKKGVILINTSRGLNVNTKDLIHGLESGQIGGACLDVFENEKPHSFSPEEHQLYKSLYTMDNVVLSPHIAGWTHESLRKIAEVLLSKISLLL